MDETLLLTKAVVVFRNAHPELIAQWERQLALGDAHPDLYFCYIEIEGFQQLNAHLHAIDYRTDFAINAHIVHSGLQEEFIGNGHDGNQARELANEELRRTYTMLNRSEAITEDLKTKVYLHILAAESHGAL